MHKETVNNISREHGLTNNECFFVCLFVCLIKTFYVFPYCKVLQDDLNRKILDSLLDFTRKCSSTRQLSDWASQMRASEIPTAALVLGKICQYI